jgi:acetyltransferase-like isoleucine patch superfamily enzyme
MQDKLKEGEALFAKGKFDEARRVFCHLLEADPKNAEVLNNLGVLSYSQNHLQEAEDYFLKAVAVKEDYLNALLNLSKLYQSSERWEKAANQLERFLSIGNQDCCVLDELGKVYLKMGQNEKAREVLAKSIHVNPDQKTDRESFQELRGNERASAVAPPKKEAVAIAMKKQVLLEVIKKVCYFPHPEVHTGQLVLSNEIFKNNDRETNVVISPGARIDLTGNIIIGPWAMIGEGTTIFTHDHYHEGRDRPLLKLQEEKGVKWLNKRVGRDVWLHGCTILAQVTTIPDGVVVGAGSVLTKNPGYYEIWAGNPAKKVGER